MQFNSYLVHCYSWIQVPTFTYQLILLQPPNQVQYSTVTIYLKAFFICIINFTLLGAAGGDKTIQYSGAVASTASTKSTL